MCAKCKLQLGEHLIDNQNASNSIHQQCHDFLDNDKIPVPKSDAEVFIDNFPFQEFNSQELIKLQNTLKNEHLAREQNLINAQKLINSPDADEISLRLSVLRTSSRRKPVLV